MSGPSWRAMTAGDLDGVHRLSLRVYPQFFERRDVYADRLALYPQGSLVLDSEGGIGGYAVGHPARLFAPPPLDTVLGRLTEGADALYVHDVALAPELRGLGLVEGGVHALLALADRDRRPAMLVSVNGTPAFWQRFAFAPVDPARLGDKLAPYGEGAIFMLRKAKV